MTPLLLAAVSRKTGFLLPSFYASLIGSRTAEGRGAPRAIADEPRPARFHPDNPACSPPVTACCRFAAGESPATVATDPSVPGRPGPRDRECPAGSARQPRYPAALWPGLARHLAVPDPPVTRWCSHATHPPPLAAAAHRGLASRGGVTRPPGCPAVRPSTGLPATSQPGRAGAPARSRPADHAGSQPEW